MWHLHNCAIIVLYMKLSQIFEESAVYKLQKAFVAYLSVKSFESDIFDQNFVLIWHFFVVVVVVLLFCCCFVAYNVFRVLIFLIRILLLFSSDTSLNRFHPARKPSKHFYLGQSPFYGVLKIHLKIIYEKYNFKNTSLKCTFEKHIEQAWLLDKQTPNPQGIANH